MVVLKTTGGFYVMAPSRSANFGFVYDDLQSALDAQESFANFRFLYVIPWIFLFVGARHWDPKPDWWSTLVWVALALLPIFFVLGAWVYSDMPTKRYRQDLHGDLIGISKADKADQEPGYGRRKRRNQGDA